MWCIHVCVFTTTLCLLYIRVSIDWGFWHSIAFLCVCVSVCGVVRRIMLLLLHKMTLSHILYCASAHPIRHPPIIIHIIITQFDIHARNTTIRARPAQATQRSLEWVQHKNWPHSVVRTPDFWLSWPFVLSRGLLVTQMIQLLERCWQDCVVSVCKCDECCWIDG